MLHTWGYHQQKEYSTSSSSHCVTHGKCCLSPCCTYMWYVEPEPGMWSMSTCPRTTTRCWFGFSTPPIEQYNTVNTHTHTHQSSNTPIEQPPIKHHSNVNLGVSDPPNIGFWFYANRTWVLCLYHVHKPHRCLGRRYN